MCSELTIGFFCFKFWNCTIRKCIFPSIRSQPAVPLQKLHPHSELDEDQTTSGLVLCAKNKDGRV